MSPSLDARLEKVLDLLLDPVCMVRPDGCFAYVNAAFERVFGYAPQEVIGRNMLDLVHPDDRVRTIDTVRNIMAGTPTPGFENRYIRKDGSTVHIMWSARWSEDDRMRIAVARDMTELKRTQGMKETLYAISEAAHTAEDLLGLYARIHGIVGRMMVAENFFVAMHDVEHDQIRFPYFVDAFDPPPTPLPFDSGTLSAQVIRSGKPLLISPDHPREPGHAHMPTLGHEILNWLGVPLFSKNQVVGAVVVQSYTENVRYTAQDMELLQFVSTQIALVIERKQAETRLRHLARHDALTDLTNRETFHDRVELAMEQARKNRRLLAVLYVDLDSFKQVNDQHGHAVGDQLLRHVARRLLHCIRDSDTVGRVGGDEFTVLIENLSGPDCAGIVAWKIRDALAQPFHLDGHTVYITPSIGIAIFPEHGQDRKQLIHRADDAMYLAKRSGGNHVHMSGTQDNDQG